MRYKTTGILRDRTMDDKINLNPASNYGFLESRLKVLVEILEHF